MLFAPEAQAASSFKAQDGLYAVYNSTSASTAAKYNAWRQLRRKNPALPRPNAFSSGQPGGPEVSGFVVAAKGGRIARADKTAIVLPPGALTKNLLVTISTAAARSDFEMAVRARKMDAANLIAVSSGVAFGPEGTPLKTPAMVILPFISSKIQAQGLSEFDLQVYRWNRDKQTWDWLPTTGNADGTVSGQVPRLSVYQILAHRPRQR